MNHEEFDNTFDVLFNNVTSNQAPGLNTYEKSLFLTKAQDEVLKNYFNPKGNKYQEGYDGNAKRQIDFSTITVVKNYDSFGEPLFDTREESKLSDFPSDVMMVINEKAIVKRNCKDTVLTVVPIAFDEYNRMMSKPYKRPLKHQAWRLINNSTSNKVDLVVGPADSILKYTVRYIKQPKPIIIGDLDGLSIHGYQWGQENTPEDLDRGSWTNLKYRNGEPIYNLIYNSEHLRKVYDYKTIEEAIADGWVWAAKYPDFYEKNVIFGDHCCELDPMLHEEIIQRAVELAKVAWVTTGNENLEAVITAGQRSE